MRVFRGFEALPHFVRPVVTVGSYDGVHKGHRKLLGHIAQIARKTGGESVVITFSPHPRTIVNKDNQAVSLLNTLKEKEILLDSVGVDNLIIVPFTPEFRKITSYDFVQDYLVGRVGVDTLVVGYNHNFGYNKQGNFDYLWALSEKLHFSVYEVPRQDVDDQMVSSTAIRALIQGGEVEEAAKYLGHPYFITARVGLGGVLAPEDRLKLMPGDGQYNVVVKLTDLEYPATITIADGVATIDCPDMEQGGDIIIFFRG